MKLLTVGISNHDHNMAYFDGKQVYYCKFERVKQFKHFYFDTVWQWIKEAEKIWGIKIEEIDEIAVDMDPELVSKEYLNSEDYQNIYNLNHLFYKIKDNYNVFNQYGIKNAWHVNHHYAHALSSWMLEDLNNKPLIRVVVDAAGDGKTVTIFKNDQIIKSVSWTTGSIGFGMEDVGDWMGVTSFTKLDHAGKLMGLQSYGKLDEEFLKVLNQFDINQINQIFDVKQWTEHKGDLILARHTNLDWLRTLHERIGDLLVEFISEYASPDDVISYSGGVAQNVIWNTKLIKKFKNIIIPPHSSDEGTSLGTLEFLRIKNNLPPMTLPNFPYAQTDEAPLTEPNEETITFAATALAEGKIIGWYQGHGEIGPRALGHRSILMDPRIPDGKKLINSVKKRENYRPFGASILKEYLKDYFTLDIDDKYMLFTNLLKVNNLKSITHVDETCRVQSVPKNMDSFRKLLEKFYEITNCPILLNTSLNINGKPIAAYPEAALDLFYRSKIDYMIIGNTIYKK
jgi:carbamoyltransferase